MTSKKEVENFLKEFKIKLEIFDILFRDERGKNARALSDLEITPNYRKEIIKKLKTEDYSEGPLQDKLHGNLTMWMFGREVKSKEVYIKISMGIKNTSVICISFHIAEYPMSYPFK